MHQKIVKAATLALLLSCIAGARPAPSGAASPTIETGIREEALSLPAWTKGTLDIHHIQTGRGNATFLVLPDGTTILIDAGALADDWGKDFAPLKLAPAAPDNSMRPGQWIADYIKQFAPRDMQGLDYALITHFHDDHFGAIRPDLPKSSHGDWALTGVTDVAEKWPISTLVDRAYPGYDFPLPLRGNGNRSLQNYFRFVDGSARSGHTGAQSLAVGRADQFRLRREPARFTDFSIRGIAANGVIWNGRENGTKALLSKRSLIGANGTFNENPLSTVIKLTYGRFDYVTGGDLTGISEPDQRAWFDMESQVAPVIGAVEAMTLNHHGNRDATNAKYLSTLQPQVLVQQTWVSDHPGGEVVQRIASTNLWSGRRDVFATYIAPETMVAIGPVMTRSYKPTTGHIVIRVLPGGESYQVYVLNAASRDRNVLSQFGPYISR